MSPGSAVNVQQTQLNGSLFFETYSQFKEKHINVMFAVGLKSGRPSIQFVTGSSKNMVQFLSKYIL